MSEYVIRQITRESDLNNITYLNLFNNRIKVMEGMGGLYNLKTLILSFNQIEEI